MAKNSTNLIDLERKAIDIDEKTTSRLMARYYALSNLIVKTTITTKEYIKELKRIIGEN